MPLKPGTNISDLSLETSSAAFAHPAQKANVRRIVELLAWLDECEQPGEYYELQRHLFGYLYRVEEHRAQCSRTIKRLSKGRSKSSDCPELPNGTDPGLLDSWELEVWVYERLARQLRSVGDALAWRCFDYDRRLILALSQNESSGMIYNPNPETDGLPYELGLVTDIWENKRQFGLLHDLTNCLRICDVTEFRTGGGPLLHEVKKKRKVPTAQRDRAQAAVNAVAMGGRLPNPHHDMRFFEADEPYRSNTKELRDLIHLAHEHGCRGMRLPQSRALVCSSLPVLAKRYAADPEEFGQVIGSIERRAIKRAGIANATNHVTGNSGDSASRDRSMVPWGIYPLSPEDRAAIICDLVVFRSVVSVDGLVESLHGVGLEAEVLLPKSDQLELVGNMDVLRVRWGDRALKFHAPGMSLLLYELVEPMTWARGIRELIQGSVFPASPVLILSQERDAWM